MIVETLLASVCGLVVGSLTHEVAHYATARAAGVRAQVGLVKRGLLVSPETGYEIPDAAALDRAIRLAPLVSGLAVAVLWVGLETRWPAWPVLAWWVSHTLAGGAADYRHGGESVPVPTLDDRQTELALLAVSTACLYAVWGLYTVGISLPSPIWYALLTLCVGGAIGFGTAGALRVSGRTEVQPR